MIKNKLSMFFRRWAMFPAILLAFSGTSFAQSPVVSCDRGNYTVVFVNGVWNNTPEEVAISLSELRNRVGTNPRNGRPLDFKYIFNRGRGRIEDLEETFRLGASTLGLDLARLWGGFDSQYFEERGENLTETEKKAIDDFYLKTANEQAALYLDSMSESVPDFASAITQLRNPTFLPPANSLILVGHSEGTVFTQLLYTSLLGSSRPRSDNSMRLLSVAAAASNVPGRSNADAPAGQAWVTNTKDLVIGGLRILRTVQRKPVPLPSNVVGSLDMSSNAALSGHLFSTYTTDATLGAAISQRFDAYIEKMAVPSEGSSCRLKLTVEGTQPGWTVTPEVTLSSFVIMARSDFNRFGSPGNTCGGERSNWSIVAPITSTARFYGVGTVVGAPFQTNASPNRRPCSSFVAYDLIPDPAGKQLPRYRIWANATARSQQFGGPVIIDWENQLRFDSGDPWNSNNGAVCVAGIVANAGFFGPAFMPRCTAALLPTE